eukprot:CAMPEP_0178447390 /NCGR_PEP_ID=MMETSP0689_2-20121128/41367_1 /TAXON_ID=160604 /ORGANISM="Amphidinium massartii, Strain CS-259" /LENGTH=35 /DNA_ID= /DNA_START= /DNA_END= /DNA_ORIENTATION=
MSGEKNWRKDVNLPAAPPCLETYLAGDDEDAAELG